MEAMFKTWTTAQAATKAPGTEGLTSKEKKNASGVYITLKTICPIMNAPNAGIQTQPPTVGPMDLTSHQTTPVVAARNVALTTMRPQPSPTSWEGQQPTVSTTSHDDVGR